MVFLYNLLGKKRTVTGLQRVKIDKYHYWLIEYKIKKKKIELTSG